MAIFQVNKKNSAKNKNIKKVTGWVMLAVATFVFLFSVTSLVPALQYFFLGILGIFVYPLCVIAFIIALALLNDKKYVMPKRYAIFLTLSLYLFLSIIQLIILGSPKGLSYGQFIALNYSKQFTAGGMIIGFLPSTLMYLMGQVATYIILSIALIVCVAFFVEAVLSLRKTENQQKPIKLQIKEKPKQVKNLPADRESIVFDRKEEPNIMFNGHVEEEKTRELTAREKLGLVGGNRDLRAYSEQNNSIKLPEEKAAAGKVPNGMSIKEYLLTPPQVDINTFGGRARSRVSAQATMQPQSSSQGLYNNLTVGEIKSNISSLKDSEDIKPSSFVHEESYDFSQTQSLRRGNLPEVKPEQITSEAEDIIRSVVEQEKKERGDDYSEYIDFGDVGSEVEEVHEQDVQPLRGRDNLTEGRGFSRDRDQLARNDRLSSGLNDNQQGSSEHQNFTRSDRADILAEQSGSAHENGAVQNQQHENRFTKPPVNDEMEKRKRFVELDDNKPSQKIVPYKYTRPPIDLITTKSDDLSMFNEEVPMKRVALENALENFGVPAKVQNVVIGPTVTRYEIEMPEGISVKKILSLDADIAYALSAKGQIRIEAPIPGRSIVGIEVPNDKVAKVSIKDVLQSKEFTLSPSPLTFALGKDITGNVRVCNLQKMPHLLVAGTTGSGKSVCLNTIITSILYKASPDEVKFILIDPKQVELSMYEGLPHLVVPHVITDPTKAVNALQWAVDEMERRFNLISEERVRNIGEYNKLDKVLQNKVKKMPYLVIIFDEFADFMSVAKNEIEDKIRRLAGKARAAGIHLILATQRPSTDVVTGTLKANLPARIAFKVASRVDSEVIMGATGAEKLLGYGDMLYKPADSEPVRLQGCFIDTPETKDIVNFITTNNEEIFDEEANNAINNPGKSTGGGNGGGDNGVDPLLPQALKICIDNGVASTTMVQRKLSIGYPRAARIVDQMEERGYIASADGSKQRAVYITIDEFYTIFGDIYD